MVLTNGTHVVASLLYGLVMFKVVLMKDSIHPKYLEITATCSCGNVIKTRSTVSKNINLDICSSCHPFYTGKQKVVDTAGRVDKFNKRFGMLSSS